MSVDTKGFIALNGFRAESNVLNLIESIEKSLKTVAIEQDKKLNIIDHVITTSGSIYTRFRLFKGSFFNCTEFENRMLATNLKCSCDHSEIYVGDKVTFSLEAVGSSKVIITQILKDLKVYGTAYFLDNAYNGEWQVLLNNGELNKLCLK